MALMNHPSLAALSSSGIMISGCDVHKPGFKSRLQKGRRYSKSMWWSLQAGSRRDNFTSDGGVAVVPKWVPSNDTFVQEEESIDIDEEPSWMFLPIERTLERKKLGVTEEMVRRISEYNNEPEWMLQFRLDAFHQLLAMEMPMTAKCPPIDFRAMYSRIFTPDIHQRQTSPVGTDVDDGISFVVGQKKLLEDAGVIFCSILEAIREHPELIRKYLGKVVAPSDNFYGALNSAVFLHGSFCYVPPNVTCPLAISSLFLVDGSEIPSPFERKLIVCDENAFVSSLECTFPAPNPHGQKLRAPVIELFCAAGGEIKHITMQNWEWLDVGATPSTHEDGQDERLCNFVTERGLCDGAGSKITWTMVDVGSGVIWQHPAVVLKGDASVGECYSVALTDARQRADIGATMIHKGNQTRSRIVGKTIAAGLSRSCFRGAVHVESESKNARSEAEWDSILIGDHSESTSCPSVVAKNTTADIEAKGITSKISKEQVFFFQQRGISADMAAPLILSGFCDVVLRELPLEFETEVREMVAMKIEEFVKASYAQ